MKRLMVEGIFFCYFLNSSAEANSCGASEHPVDEFAMVLLIAAQILVNPQIETNLMLSQIPKTCI